MWAGTCPSTSRRWPSAPPRRRCAMSASTPRPVRSRCRSAATTTTSWSRSTTTASGSTSPTSSRPTRPGPGWSACGRRSACTAGRSPSAAARRAGPASPSRCRCRPSNGEIPPDGGTAIAPPADRSPSGVFRHSQGDKEGHVSHGLDPQTSELIEQTLPLVRHVMYQVTSHFPRHVDKEELVRAGVLGLVEAAHRYDPTQGVPFPPYAAQRIRGAIIDAVRKVDWAPRSLRRAGRNLEATAEKLANDLRRTPTATELAGALGISLTVLAELQHQLLQSVVLGLDMAVSDTFFDGDDDVHLEGTVPDDGVSVDDDLCDREMAAYLRDAVALLPDRHRVVVQGYFFDGRTSAELAEELEITVSRVSQLRTEAFEILRH